MNSENERKFVESFVRREKKDRLLGFFASKSKRFKGLLHLQHFDPEIFDSRFAEKVAADISSPDDLYNLLKSRGASDDCYVFSNCETIDQCSMSLHEAVAAVYGIGIGTLISCIPGQLLYFEGELFPDQYILQRK